jgi:hypothetical protein
MTSPFDNQAKLNALTESGGVLTFSGVQVNQVGSVSAPSITFSGDTNTGIYQVTEGQIDFTINGTRSLTLNSASQLIVCCGSQSAPAITFDGDVDTGVFSDIANHIQFTCGGTERLRINSIGNLLMSGADTNSSPTYSFLSDNNTGMYNISADNLGFTTGGTLRQTINSTGVGIGISPSVALDVSGDIEYTGTITDVSDRKYKSNIKPFVRGECCDKISQLSFYNYDLTINNTLQIGKHGLMADEVELIFPEIVHKRTRGSHKKTLKVDGQETLVDVPTENYKGVSYEQLYRYGLVAIQELIERVEVLEKLIVS